MILIWFQEKRLAKNLTKRKLSEISGINESLIGKYENGIRRPPPDKAQILGDILEFDWQLFYPKKDTSIPYKKEMPMP